MGEVGDAEAPVGLGTDLLIAEATNSEFPLDGGHHRELATDIDVSLVGWKVQRAETGEEARGIVERPSGALDDPNGHADAVI